jgi:hypothetical protein
MRLLTVLACLVLSALVLAAPTTAARTTVSFEARFNESFGRAAAHRCPPSETFSFCGEGTVAGFGHATTFSELVDFSGTDETGCGEAVFHRTITLDDGSTLVLRETGTVCFPGESSTAPGSLKSFGNPSTFEGTFEVIRGTGTFKGATGTGTVVTRAAGDTGSSTLSGTLTLR